MTMKKGKALTQLQQAFPNGSPGEAKGTNMAGRFIHDEDGQDLIEYGLLAALTVIIMVAAMTAFEGVITAAWAAISANLAS
jgi:Flp pilus assembly pilin Flp